MERQGQRPPDAARVARLQVRGRLFGKARECPTIRLARECQKLGQRAQDGAKVRAWHDCQARHAKVMRALTC